MLMEKLETWSKEHHLPLEKEQLAQFETYAKLLLLWNERMNLTRITDEEGIVVKHFIDSLTPACFYDFSGKELIDIGTGAGFPGIPLKIMFPSLKLTLMDSLQKRLLFLEEVCRELDLSAKTVHSRAEEGGNSPLYREQFDIAISRAVAGLPTLSEYCLPYVKVGGVMIARKGPDGQKELEMAERAIDLLGGIMRSKNDLTLPDGSQRCVLIVDKAKPTPSLYPRRGVKISKRPIE